MSAPNVDDFPAAMPPATCKLPLDKLVEAESPSTIRSLLITALPFTSNAS